MEWNQECGSQEKKQFTCEPYVRMYTTNDGAATDAGPDTHKPDRCDIPTLHGYPPASRGNAVLIPVRTNCTAMAMSSIPIRRLIARYSRWPTFDMI